jgi:hypothetical protein
MPANADVDRECGVRVGANLNLKMAPDRTGSGPKWLRASGVAWLFGLLVIFYIVYVIFEVFS